MKRRPELIKSLVGETFGRLTAVECILKIDGHGTLYRCICSCGKEVIVPRGNLTHKNTKSCGCLKLENIRRRRITDFEARINEVGRYYRRNAVVRKIEWSLSKAEVQEIVTKPCIYCNETPNPAIGIDRIDNQRGYDFENCVPCCKRCNQAKNDMCLTSFLDWVRKISKVMGDKNWQICS